MKRSKCDSTYDMDKKDNIRRGWMCPKCGNVYAPWVAGCRKCNGGRIVNPDQYTTAGIWEASK